MTEKLKFYYLTDDNLSKEHVYTFQDLKGLTVNMFHPDNLERLIEAGSFMFDFVDYRKFCKSEDYQAVSPLDKSFIEKSIDLLRWIE